MATKKKVIWSNSNNPLTEIYQSVNIKYAFAGVNKKGVLQQCHDWVKCRDFLHDVVRTSLTGNPSQIYGFKFNKEENPEISTDKIQMLISMENIHSPIKFRRLLNRSLRMINYYENSLNEELSTLEKVSNNENSKHKHVWLFTGPKFWLSAPHLVSFYSLLIRLGHDTNIDIKSGKPLEESFKRVSELRKENKISRTNDTDYISKIHKNIRKILLDNKEISNLNEEGFSDVYYKDIVIGNFHDTFGIVSVCGMKTVSKEFNKRIKTNLKKELGDEQQKKAN